MANQPAMSSAGGGETEARHSNRLAKEQSPYLLQHAHNPVDWYPWGEEAFAKARAEDKPIFLSEALDKGEQVPDALTIVLLPLCQWPPQWGTPVPDLSMEACILRCHVMEVESFESEEVAKIMNHNFVNIKVDREERPDVDKHAHLPCLGQASLRLCNYASYVGPVAVDQVYMTYVQATQGGGGWPMSVWLTPDLKPILGGTYFPPEDSYGRLGFKAILKRVREAWDARRTDVEGRGQAVMEELSKATQSSASTTELPPGLAARALSDRYDSRLGGFGSAPKFPRPSEINILLRQHLRSKQQRRDKTAQKVLDIALFSLRAMARGGMHDHVGGGFHRYSVDEHWHVPHFEKMLYDQGQLANTYLDAFTITQDPQYALVARDVLDYLRRDLTHSQGGIFSAEDADSLEEGAQQKKEGAFYVWRADEIEDVLDDEEAKVVNYHYYIKAEGNCDLSSRSDPHHEFKGLNCLIQRHEVSDTAKTFGMTVEKVEELLGESRAKLHARREQRPRPHLDDKVIVAWNGLAISAFARASRILQSEPSDMRFNFPIMGVKPTEYLTSAIRSASFIKANIYDPSSRRLRRSFRQSQSEASGFIDDYAFLIAGLLDLFEASGDVQWLSWALDLQQTQDELFLDQEGGGYFSVAEGDPSILLRMKEDYDGAEPSGNSIAATNLLRLSAMLTGELAKTLRSTAEHTMAVFEERLKEMPLALPQMCCAVDQLASPAKRQVIISGDKESTVANDLVKAVFSVYEPDCVVLQVDSSVEQDRSFWEEHNSSVLTMSKSDISGQPAAYICQNFTCRAPTSNTADVRRLLQEAPAEPRISSLSIGDLMQRKS
eukprot:SM000073S21404  [mRNA]  locus=s73:76458:81626:- [translate_table: standard]